MRLETRRSGHHEDHGPGLSTKDGAVNILAIIKNIVLSWLKRGEVIEEIDFSAGYTEPWIEQSIRDFECQMKSDRQQ